MPIKTPLGTFRLCGVFRFPCLFPQGTACSKNGRSAHCTFLHIVAHQIPALLCHVSIALPTPHNKPITGMHCHIPSWRARWQIQPLVVSSPSHLFFELLCLVSFFGEPSANQMEGLGGFDPMYRMPLASCTTASDPGVPRSQLQPCWALWTGERLHLLGFIHCSGPKGILWDLKMRSCGCCGQNGR